MAGTLPDKSWTLPQLATFVSSTVRRTGEDAWWIAEALEIARVLHKQDRDWLRWLREDVEGLSKSTAYRYLDIRRSFSLEEVRNQPLNVIYKLMAVREDDDLEEQASDGDDVDVADDTDEVLRDSQPEEQIIAGRIGGKASQSASERDTDIDGHDNPKSIAPPQPPVTADEIDALTTFLEAVGGLARAEYVFRAGIEQLRELKNEEG